MIEIYTDGSVSGNPGPGGWAAIIIVNGGTPVEISGGENHTTNNRMEMQAVIEGLKYIVDTDYEVRVYSDSAYVVNCLQKQWHVKWKKNDWKIGQRPVSNVDLWKEMLELVEKHDATFHKVKGHSDNFYNNRCDELAVTQTKRRQKGCSRA